MNKIKIEWISSIESEYPYLELFYENDKTPFLEISISERKQLLFKLYSCKKKQLFEWSEIEFIIRESKDFLAKALKNESDYQILNNIGYE